MKRINKEIFLIVQLNSKELDSWLDQVISFEVFTWIEYWALRVASGNSDHLIYDRLSESPSVSNVHRSKLLTQAENAWVKENKLPKGFYVLNEEVAINAYKEGVKKFGLNWMVDSKADRHRYDAMIQMALFGEVRYS